MGRIGLPLCQPQAVQLKGLCEQAPYGRREETIVDTSVRNAWQLDASQLTIGRGIQEVVTSLIPELANDLGCEGAVISALPYKLVLYEEGGFFLPHRDTEKAQGMFATLVIQLPAEHTGGELIVKHNGKQKVFDFSAESASKIFYAAFFADCKHELRRVTSGLRLCLIYNLVHTGNEPTPSPADHRQAVARIIRSIKTWAADPNGPTKLIYVLQHQYTQAGLSFRGLKNRDRAVAQVLRLAAQEVELDVYLAIIVKHESGSAEPSCYFDYYKRHCGSENPADWSMGEIYNSEVTLNDWVGLDDTPSSLSKMSIDEESELMEDPFDDLDPEVEVEECSGNSGVTMEHWYRQAALVFWPHANMVAIKLAARIKSGIEVAVKSLQADIKVCRERGATIGSKEWQECQEMTHLVVKHLEKQRDYTYSYHDYCVATMLTNVQSCGDLQLYIDYLAVVAKRKFSAKIASSLLLGCKHFGWSALHDALCAMLQYNTKNSKALGDCVSVVVMLAAEGGPNIITDEQQLHTCRELATTVYSAVIASTEAVPVAAIFKMLYVIDQPQLLQEAVRYVKTRPEQYHVMDQPQKATSSFRIQPGQQVKTSLATVVLELSSWLGGAKSQECGSFVELLEMCIETLTAKANITITEPVSWAMKVPFTPCCSDCKDLARFLSNHSQQVGRFKMVKMRRMHLHQRLDGGGIDASHVTERVGSPQTLVVTKTRTHLQHQRDQQKKALELLASLRALPAAASITTPNSSAAADRGVPAPVVPDTAPQEAIHVVDLTTA